jgi:hypothetical protein
MDEITLLDPRGYDLKETILIEYKLYYAKHHVCQLCGGSECVQYWVEGNGVDKSDLPVLNDVMIYGKLFGRCIECRIENPEILAFYRPRIDLFPLEENEYSGLRMDRYDPNRDHIVTDSTLIEWDKIK